MMSHVNVTLSRKGAHPHVLPTSLHVVAEAPKNVPATVRTALPAPILSPPPEIISRIIELGSFVEADFPIHFSHICRSLRQVSLSNPTFWSTVRFVGGKPSSHEVVERLRRSRDAPLEISATKLDTREDGLKLLELFYPHVARWRSLNLEVWETAAADVVLRSLVNPAPLLESLSISGFTTTPVNPFGGVTPALKHLVVRGVPLVWSSPLFHNLESLHVHSSNWTTPGELEKWTKLKNLTIRADPMQPLTMNFSTPTVSLPELECLELNGVTEEDIVRLLSFAEMPALNRLLFTHIKDSPNQVVNSIFPLNSVRHLRLHATEMCQDNLLSVLRKVRNLDVISFEDSSPIPAFIGELSQTDNTIDWVCPKLATFQVVAFEKDNAQRAYDDTDIIAALRVMMEKRQRIQKMVTRMCIFEGERNEQTRHAAPWNEERRYKSEKHITLDA